MTVEVLTVLLVTGVPALASALVVVWGALRSGRAEVAKNKAQAAKDRADDRERIIDRLEAQLQRLEEHSRQQQDAISQLHEEHSECHAQLAEMYVYLLRFHDHARWLTNELTRLGGTPCESPEMPPKPSRRVGAEYLRRTTEQNQASMEAVDTKLTGPK